MKIFVAEASGVSCQPAIAELILQGHTVPGMSRSKACLQNLVPLVATIAVVDAFDESAVEQVLRRAEAKW